LKEDGTPAAQTDLRNTRQTLDLWTGVVTSRFELGGVPVTVTTACHPTLDSVAIDIESPLLKAGRIAAFLDVPGNDPLQFANFVGDWDHPGRLEDLGVPTKNRADFTRTMDGKTYFASLAWLGDASLSRPEPKQKSIKILKAEYGSDRKSVDITALVAKRVQAGETSIPVGNSIAGDPDLGFEKSMKVSYELDGKPMAVTARENELLRLDPDSKVHGLLLTPSQGRNEFSFVCAFSPQPLPEDLPCSGVTVEASRKSWSNYWKRGGAIDLSGSTDPRAKELERRIVLSQYLMKVNEAGSYPPQESGLVNNGWFGRWHMEMYWWHAAHWALWNRWPELDRSLGIYNFLLPKAKVRAAAEGYKGSHWPKCIGPDDVEWPHIIHSLLMWQQPHPIFFAELDYRAHPTQATLKKWWPVVQATADFLSTSPFLDPATHKYILGPPLVLVSENTDPKTTKNPTFELGYWRFGLRTAQEWRKRLGMPQNPQWAKVLANLAPLPQQEGVYVLHEGVQDMWTKWNFEHPALTGAFGLLPGDGVDKAAMHRTLDEVSSNWNFARTWGWDFPMLAMCAARLGEPDRAIDFLLTKSEGFQFDQRGLATGGPFPYFPSNGGLLYAVALMAAGWDGEPETPTPGFPKNGKWKVRYENMSPAP
jgi:hypothetical protein